MLEYEVQMEKILNGEFSFSFYIKACLRACVCALLFSFFNAMKENAFLKINEKKF